MAGKLKLTDEVQKQILGMVVAGLHPEQAFVAAGLHASTYRQYVLAARNGHKKKQQFVDLIAEAVAKAEAADVVTTKRAATIERAEVHCPECGERVMLDPLALITMGGQLEQAMRLKGAAAGVALQRLMLRFPKRWSPRIVHTVAEEHDRLLDVAQRVLAPEAFELLLEEYIASSESAREIDAAAEPAEPGALQ